MELTDQAVRRASCAVQVRRIFNIKGDVPDEILDILTINSGERQILPGIFIEGHAKLSFAVLTNGADPYNHIEAQDHIPLCFGERTAKQAKALFQYHSGIPTFLHLFPRTSQQVNTASLLFLDGRARMLSDLKWLPATIEERTGKPCDPNIHVLLNIGAMHLARFYCHENMDLVSASSDLTLCLALNLKTQLLGLPALQDNTRMVGTIGHTLES